VKPESKQMLTGILTYHVVPGNLSAADLAKQVKDGGGKAMLKTASGGQLTSWMQGGGKLSVTDAKGGKSMVTIADVKPVERRHPRRRHGPDARELKTCGSPAPSRAAAPSFDEPAWQSHDPFARPLSASFPF
jgi:hypothetical protein